MIEESVHYNLQMETLTRIDERPDTSPRSGTHRSGFRAPAAPTPDKYLQIQQFGLSYFKAAGADFHTGCYGVVLMDLSIPRS
jgi:hypothetical protein